MLLDVPSYPKELTDGWPVFVLVALVVLIAAIALIVVLRRRGAARTTNPSSEWPTTAPTTERSPGPAPDAPQAPRKTP
ncbi:hypothetical protein HMPREF1531_01739 [Propionibacterium sp. oral taxon 192 str. F0372]|uniref:hypothetical protein n=1 Tax=Propionibacterium sp. oral taxon 192 TaxID=671222 RepID=UPI000353C2FE|nr:hypothetical protein [Propionibacterium sp. oral taxon 192]EPH02433.1 hypothetical protein HMPREF1531_01739 [Propionibacterium sp. oral taxon 192 str. F0372]